jgi:hypothetical protein
MDSDQQLVERSATTHVPRTYRIVAATQIIGAALALVSGAFMTQGAWWFLLLLEAPCAAAILAGVWLWKGQSRGVQVTRIILLAEVLRLTAPYFAYAATCGFYLDVTIRNNVLSLRYGYLAALSAFIFSGQVSWSLSINLWAIGMLLLLQRGRRRSGSSAKKCVDRL